MDGDTLTGNAYIALEQGPVVARYDKRLVQGLEREGLARQRTDGWAKPIRLAPGVEPTGLSEADLQRAGEIAEWVQRQTSSAISQRSHQNPGWKLAYDTGLAGDGKPRSSDMIVAMQELLDDDPWMDEPLTAEEKAAVAEVDLEGGIPPNALDIRAALESLP